jgi:hypothetical protein
MYLARAGRKLIIQVGLFGSGLVVYSFGRKKGAALFAF